MTIKLLQLKSGEDVIANVEEMSVGEDAEKRIIGYYLTGMMKKFNQKRMVTANVTSYLPMANFIAPMGKQHDTILSVQEHRVGVGKLGEFQDKTNFLEKGGFKASSPPPSP